MLVISTSELNSILSLITVSGEANFEMKRTGLTVDGFIQPSIARNLLEQPANMEKGLSQRFLWFAPNPPLRLLMIWKKSAVTFQHL